MILESATGNITAVGALTLKAGAGMDVHDHFVSLASGADLVLNADQDGVNGGTLTVYAGKTIATSNGDLKVTAWDIDLQDGWEGGIYITASIDAGTATILLHASSEGQSMGVGSTAQDMHVTDSELLRMSAVSGVTFTRLGDGAIVINDVSRTYSTKLDSVVFGDPEAANVVSSKYKRAQIPQVKTQSYSTAADFVVDAGTPRLELASSVVSLGEDVVVRWQPDVYSDRLSHERDWVGLFVKGDCANEETTAHNRLHKCYLASYYTTPGQSHGETRFSHSQYKEAGEYEVRYFYGDSTDGHGYRCVTLGGTGSTYTQCVLHAQSISAPIHIKQVAVLTNTPGLVEKYCDGNKKVCE